MPPPPPPGNVKEPARGQQSVGRRATGVEARERERPRCGRLAARQAQTEQVPFSRFKFHCAATAAAAAGAQFPVDIGCDIRLSPALCWRPGRRGRLPCALLLHSRATKLPSRSLSHSPVRPCAPVSALVELFGSQPASRPAQPYALGRRRLALSKPAHWQAEAAQAKQPPACGFTPPVCVRSTFAADYQNTLSARAARLSRATRATTALGGTVVLGGGGGGVKVPYLLAAGWQPDTIGRRPLQLQCQQTHSLEGEEEEEPPDALLFGANCRQCRHLFNRSKSRSGSIERASEQRTNERRTRADDDNEQLLDLNCALLMQKRQILFPWKLRAHLLSHCVSVSTTVPLELAALEGERERERDATLLSSG